MKKSVLLTFLAGAMLLFGCAKDSELADSVKNLEKRVTTLEETVAQMNTEIAGIKNIITAIREGKDASFIYVKSVTPIPAEQGGGYTIVFSDGTTAEIHDGIQGPVGPEGPSGPAPVMGAKEVGGVFVWTANGEVVKDAEGNPVPVFGPLPQLRIKDGKWEVSYDEGKTWAVVPTMGQSGSAITIIDKENEVIFIIDGKEYSVKKEMPFFMEFDQRTDIGVKKGESALIEYFIKGAGEADNVEVDVLNITSAGWAAEVVSIATAETPGYIKVTNNDDSEAKIFVYATNGKGKTDIKSLQFEGGVLDIVAEVKPVDAPGGDIAVNITTNMQYDVNKDPLASWITIVEPTKATHTDAYKIIVSENKLGQFRSGNVYVVDTNSGETVKTFTILQYPKATTTTDIYTLNRVEDGTPVKMFSLAVVAASKVSSLVTDGYDVLNVKGVTLPLGKEVSINGIKQSTESAPYVIAESFEVTSETTTIESPDINWSMFAAFYAPLRTSITSVLLEGEDGYCFGSVNGDEFYVEEPVSDLSSYVGKYVNINGYSTEYIGETEDGGYAANFIANEVEALTIAANAKWALSFESGSTDAVKNTVTGTTSDYILKVYDEATAKNYGLETADDFIGFSILMGSDDMMYYMYYQGKSYSSLVNSGTASMNLGSLDFGVYRAVVVGVDKNGLPTGEYQYLEFEKKDPSVFGQYSDFLGKWQSSNGVFEIVAKEEGSTYTIKNFIKCATNTGVTDVEARYDSELGKMILPEQVLGEYTSKNYGKCHDYLTGRVTYNGDFYAAYNDLNEYLEDLAIIYLCEDGSLKFKGTHLDDYDDFGYDFNRDGYVVNWIIDEGSYAGMGNYYGNFDFPSNCKKAQVGSEAYNKWIGNWDMGKSSVYDEVAGAKSDVDNFVMSISECAPNESYYLDGFCGNPVQVFFDETTGDILFAFNFVRAGSGWDMYTFGKTADGYPMTGDEDGLVARFKITGEGKGAIETVEYGGKVAAQIGCFAITDTGGWGSFTDCNYVYVPKSEITKVPSAPTAKTVGNTCFKLGELYPTTSDIMNNVNKYGVCKNAVSKKFHATKSNDGMTKKFSKKHIQVK